MQLKSKKVWIPSLVIGVVAVGALIGGLTYWALTANNNNGTISQATIYIDQNGNQQTTNQHDLSDFDSDKIVQIGYYQEKKDGPVIAAKMPKKVLEVPDTLPAQITSLKNMFRDTNQFNQNIANWNVQNVTDMSYMFYNAVNFNKNLSTWKLNPSTFFYSFSVDSGFANNEDIKPKFIKKQSTIYLDQNGVETPNDSTDLTNEGITKITQLGFFENGLDNIQVVTMPRTIVTVPTALPRQIASLYHMFYVNSFGTQSVFNQDIGDWDTSNINNMEGTFFGANKFNQNIGDWDTSNVVTMNGMFYVALDFNQDISRWDTGNVRNIGDMFKSAPSFNQNINTWNTRNVTNMGGMFYGATSFNQNLTNWKTKNVTNMSNMFFNAAAFNGDIGNWDTSNVVSMTGMFAQAKVFNQSLSKWNTQKVTTFYQMFAQAYLFNGDIQNWKTSNVTNMSAMFYQASSFNQDIHYWDTSNVTTMASMFASAGSFNQNISTWNVDNVTEYGDFATSSGIANQPNKIPPKFRT